MTVDDPGGQKPSGRVAIRSVALPAEHGGWGFLIEPILLGLLVAFSWQGLLLAFAAAGLFLLHQPLKIVVKDRLRGRRPARLVWAERFVVAYGLLTILPILALLRTASLRFLAPVLLAFALGAIQLYYDAHNQSRYLVPEIAGALALAMTAPAIAIVDGWTLSSAMLLWVILTLRTVSAILYVRSRLRNRSGKQSSPSAAWTAHAIALLVIAGLASVGLAPWLAFLAFVVLLLRALLGLSRSRKDRPANMIGFQELAYGFVTVLMVAIGYVLGF